MVQIGVLDCRITCMRCLQNIDDQHFVGQGFAYHYKNTGHELFDVKILGFADTTSNNLGMDDDDEHADYSKVETK